MFRLDINKATFVLQSSYIRPTLVTSHIRLKTPRTELKEVLYVMEDYSS